MPLMNMLRGRQDVRLVNGRVLPGVTMGNNLYKSESPVDFWVWINPLNWLVKHQIEVTAGFTSGGILGDRKTNLMFIPNPEFKGDITPYQLNIMREYMAEYNLELGREANFKNYPSRLNAIYLFDSPEEARRYYQIHQEHVGNRILKRVKSVSPCVYSKHDLSWVDFLRLAHSVDAMSIDNVSKAYWSGVKVENCDLESMGRKWTQPPIIEVLFLGRVEVYNKNLDHDDQDS